MTWDVRWAPRAVKDARRLDHQTRERIIIAIEQLARDPVTADIRPLKGTPDRWRLRVGDWRVLFWFNPAEGAVYIARVAHRSAAYRD